MQLCILTAETSGRTRRRRKTPWDLGVAAQYKVVGTCGLLFLDTFLYFFRSDGDFLKILLHREALCADAAFGALAAPTLDANWLAPNGTDGLRNERGNADT